MIPSHRIPAHPGQVLRDEFIDALGITPAELAAHLSIAPQRLHRIVRGKRAVTAETAWLLSQAFDTTPEFWLSLQAAHDLASRKPKRRIRPICDVG